MYKITEAETEFAHLVQRDKEKLLANFTASLQKAESILHLFTEPNTLSVNHNLEKNKTFWNFARYIGIVSLDLKTLAQHQALSTNEWEKRLFARQVSLLICEPTDDLLFFLGKQFAVVAADFNTDKTFTSSLNSVRRELNRFRTKYNDQLQAHRNTAIAHRDRNTEEQLKTIYSISWLDSVNICSEFDAIVNRIGQFLETMMRKGISDGPFKFNAY
jgi:hypothetical protein